MRRSARRATLSIFAAGLRGSIDQLATDRRRRLVEHAIESGLISRSQLDRLPAESD